MYFEIVFSVSAAVVSLLGWATLSEPTVVAEPVKIEETKIQWEGGF